MLARRVYVRVKLNARARVRARALVQSLLFQIKTRSAPLKIFGVEKVYGLSYFLFFVFVFYFVPIKKDTMRFKLLLFDTSEVYLNILVF